jgi:hypothetical protein
MFELFVFIRNYSHNFRIINYHGQEQKTEKA